MSEETMRKVDAEIRKIIDMQYALARKLIEENRDKIEAMTKALLEFETIDADQIKDIMEGRPPRAPKLSSKPAPKPGSGGGNGAVPEPPKVEPVTAEGAD
jgi:cell division protease FtsH